MSKIFLIIFFVLITVCVPILIYYARKNPDPRFRPRFGELILVGLFMVAGSGGLAYVMQGIFVVDDLKLRPDANRAGTPMATPSDDSFDDEDIE